MTDLLLVEDFLRLVTAESETLQETPEVTITTIRKIFAFEQRYPVQLDRTIVIETQCLLGKKSELVHIFLSADPDFYQLVHPLRAYNCVYVSRYSHSRLFFFALNSISRFNIKYVFGRAIEEITALQESAQREEIFFQTILSSLQLKHPFIRMVNRTSSVYDKRGADYQITVRHNDMQYVIPLQLKSSTGYQAEHRKKFAHIPSIVWSRNSAPDITKAKVMDIIEAYITYRETRNITYVLHETTTA
jgi:hypothetical protein